MSAKGDGESGDDIKQLEGGRMCHPAYLISLPGILRVVNIILGSIILGFWIPGFENDYQRLNQIQNFHDFAKHYGAGYKSEQLNIFALADIIISLLVSIALLFAMIFAAHSFVDWNRMNRITHAFLTIFHGIGAICGCVGVWYFEENCCRIDLEWNGIGFSYKPNIRDFGYPRNDGLCNCWLTKRQSETEGQIQYSTVLWVPRNQDQYAGEENTFISFAAHHIHLHTAAAVLMIFNTGVYALATVFTKPTPKST